MAGTSCACSRVIEFIRAICSSPVSDVVYVMRDQRGSLDLLRVPIYPDPGAVRVLLTGLPITMMGYRCTVSADGRRLLYGRRASLSSLWRLNVARPTTQATPLTRGPLDFLLPAVSPDGLWVAADQSTVPSSPRRSSRYRSAAASLYALAKEPGRSGLPTDSSWPSPLAAADPRACGSLGRTASGPKR